MINHPLREDDEEGFILYEEYIIFEIQKHLRSKEGLECKAVLELSAKLEDLLYDNTLKEHSVATTTNLWAKRDYLNLYQNLSTKFLTNLQNKTLNYKKLFDEHERNPQHIYQQILKDDSKKQSKVTKAKTTTESQGEKAEPKPPKIVKIKDEKKAKVPKITATSKKKIIPQETFTREESQAQVEELFQDSVLAVPVSRNNVAPPETTSTAMVVDDFMATDELHTLLIDHQQENNVAYEDFDLDFDFSPEPSAAATTTFNISINEAAWK